MNEQYFSETDITNLIQKMYEFYLKKIFCEGREFIGIVQKYEKVKTTFY